MSCFLTLTEEIDFGKDPKMIEPEKYTQISDQFLFPKIFRAFRIAIHPANMIIAFLAVLIISVSGVLLDLKKSVVLDDNGRTSELQVYMQNPDSVADFIDANKDNGNRRGVFWTMWRHGAAQFQDAVDAVLALNFRAAADHVARYFQAAGWAFKHHLFYALIFAAIKLVVLCLSGGAICRISALQFALGEKPGITEAIRYSIRKFPSFLAAPLAPIAISIVLSAFILALGVFMYIPYAGEIIVAVLLFLALIIAIVITIVVVGAAAGFNLMFPALAYDGLDCFDAISRAFNYVYSRPWRLGFYTGLAAVYGAICYMFVRFFAFLLLLIAHFALGLGLFGSSSDKLDAVWPTPQFSNLSGINLEAMSGTMWFSAIIIYVFVLIILGLIVAFIYSFYFSASTIIYALLRRKVDSTPLDEICTEPALAKDLTTEAKDSKNDKNGEDSA